VLSGFKFLKEVAIDPNLESYRSELRLRTVNLIRSESATTHEAYISCYANAPQAVKLANAATVDN
jgi:hypothetical protein